MEKKRGWKERDEQKGVELQFTWRTHMKSCDNSTLPTSDPHCLSRKTATHPSPACRTNGSTPPSIHLILAIFFIRPGSTKLLKSENQRPTRAANLSGVMPRCLPPPLSDNKHISGKVKGGR